MALGESHQNIIKRTDSPYLSTILLKWFLSSHYTDSHSVVNYREINSRIAALYFSICRFCLVYSPTDELPY